MSKRSVYVYPPKGVHVHVSWVISNELNALPTCIWLKIDLSKYKIFAIYIYIYVAGLTGRRRKW